MNMINNFDSVCKLQTLSNTLGGIIVEMRSLNHQANVTEWRELVADCRRSGKTVLEWCRNNQIRPSKYYYWLRVIRNESLVLAQNKLQEAQPQFTQVMVRESSQEISGTLKSNICATVKCGEFSIEINNGADTKVLEHTLRTLGSLC